MKSLVELHNKADKLRTKHHRISNKKASSDRRIHDLRDEIDALKTEMADLLVVRAKQSMKERKIWSAVLATETERLMIERPERESV